MSQKAARSNQSANQASTTNGTSKTGRLKTFYKRNPWKSRFILAAIVLILILSIMRLALSQSIIYGVTSWLKDNQIEATIEDIKINIIGGTVTLVNAKGNKDGQPLFNIGLVDLHWHWTPLSEKNAVVTKVELDDLTIDIEQYSDEMIVGGVHIPLTGSTEKNEEELETDEDIKPWGASLGEVVLTKLNICFVQHKASIASANEDSRYVDYCVKLDEMVWRGTIGYGTEQELLNSTETPLSSTGNFKLNGLTVTDNKLNKQLLSSSSNTLSNVVISGLNNIHIDKLSMNQLSALGRDDKDHEDAVRFNQLTLESIQLSNLNSLRVNSATIDDMGLYIVKLNPTNWEYQQWIPLATESTESESAKTESEKTDKPESNETQPDEPQADLPVKAEPSGFAFAINHIQVDNSDFCYQEIRQDEKQKKSQDNIYYCFNQDSLKWQGSISAATTTDGLSLSITGDLTASNTTIHNPELDRNLLDMQTISLSKLNVSDVDKATLAAFSIDSFSALQRGEKTNDSTVSFSKLTINNVDYAGKAINIDSINLADLTSKVSKNKDGSWEYEKWLNSGANNTPADGKKAAENKAAASEKKPAYNAEPILVSIKSVNVNTEKDLLYIDNSTKPSMIVGLNKLDFNIKDLNSNKPKTDSPFILFAKTTRHATIDLAGSVRPYDKKMSFDAKGKLKGFDLRAATPATKKAIGHIIKSGQLDADLELLAVKDKLDSNISLSLYQFHIKPMSDEDAKKLDTELGMPLNETLILLRDKDDSIHLDIPITGDVNAPDFSPMHAIVKATTKAATATIITFFTPYGLIYAGGNVLFDLATAMNFDPVEFAPGSPTLPADGKKQLDNLAKLLKEKPQIHLTLCGMTNKDDIHTLYPDLKASDEKDANKVKPEPALVLSKDQTIALKKLATDRQVASKDYLIKSAKITHDQLILCEPEHKSESDALAGVEINI